MIEDWELFTFSFSDHSFKIEMGWEVQFGMTRSGNQGRRCDLVRRPPEEYGIWARYTPAIGPIGEYWIADLYRRRHQNFIQSTPALTIFHGTFSFERRGGDCSVYDAPTSVDRSTVEQTIRLSDIWMLLKHSWTIKCNGDASSWSLTNGRTHGPADGRTLL